MVVALRSQRGVGVTVIALERSDRAPFLLLGSDVVLPDDVEIGAHVVIHTGVQLSAGCHLDDGAVVGRLPRLGVRSGSPVAQPASTLIGAGSSIGCYTVVNAGARIGARAYIGDHSLVREGAVLGEDCSVGHACTIGRDCLLGDRVRMQGYVGLASGVIVEDDCFFGAGIVVSAGLPLNGRDSPGPPVLHRGASVGSGAQLLPGVEIGRGAVVGAGSVVTKDVPAGVTVRGNPAR